MRNKYIQKNDINYTILEKADFMHMLKKRLGNRFKYTMTSSPLRTSTQQELKDLLHSLRIAPVTVTSSLVKCIDPLNAAVLCKAIRDGETSCIDFKILELGKRMVTMPLDACGITMLHYAALHHRYIVMIYLLKKGANRYARLTNGATPLTVLKMTSECDAKEVCLHILLQTSLLQAMKIDCVSFGKFAVEHLMAKVELVNNLGMTALHYAFKSDRPKEIALTLVTHGADLYAETKLGIRAIDLCTDRKLKESLLPIYKSHHTREKEKRKKEEEKARKNSTIVKRKIPVLTTPLSAPVNVFWGPKPQLSEIPSPLDGNFEKWHSQHFSSWSTYVTASSKHNKK